MIRSVAIAVLLSAPAVAQLARVEGRVVDAQGKPVAARIALAEVGRGTVLVPNAAEMLVVTPGESGAVRKRCSRDLQADASGKFAVDELQPGTYGFVAADTEHGFAIRELTFAASGNAPLEIALEPPRFLDVKIKDLAFDPSKHVLELRPAQPHANVSVLPRLTQDGWNFRAAPLPAINNWLVTGSELVLDRDYRATLFQQLVDSTGKSGIPTILHMKGGWPVVGRILAPNGEPLSGASVVARWSASPMNEDGAVTDAQGNYALMLRDVLGGPYACELEVRRWSLRDQAGCGNGPADVLVRREFEIPLSNEPTRVDLTVDQIFAPLAVGSLAPAFDATTVDGAKLKLSDLRGKVVLVDFWATWCALCRAEMPAMEKFYAERAKDGFEIVAISIDDDAELVRSFLASRKLPWKVIALGPPKSNPLTQLFNVWGTPATFLLDRDGKIVARNLLGEELRKKIDEVVARGQ